MIEFPELQQALVTAGCRRYSRTRRAWRIARPVLVAAACAAVVVAIVALGRDDEQERAAAPRISTADQLTRDYAVFRRAATTADEPPTAVTGMPGLRTDEARLVERNGSWRVYLVAGALDGKPVLCAFAVVGDRARFGCDAPGTLHGYAFPEAEGDPGGVVAIVPDGIELVEIGFAGRSALQAPVRHNAVLARLKRWPAGAGTIAWDAEGVHHEIALKSP